jgi:hypothetical protein
MIAFGLGVWGSASGKRILRIMGGLLVGIGVVDLVGPFTPMHQRAVLATGGGTMTDTMHIILASVDVLFILLIIGFGATAFGKRFRLYSIGTILVVVVFGALAGLDGPRIAANQPTPWVGVTERISIFGFMLWLVVLAISLLRSERHVEQPHDLAHNVLKGKSIRDMKDRNGKHMTDRHLVNTLATKYKWMPKVYESTSGFIHLSDKHLFSIFDEAKGERSVSMRIAADDENIPPELWIELADGFLAQPTLYLSI